MNDQALLGDIDRAMATTVQSVKKLESLLGALSGIGGYVEAVADEVNCMAMNVALEALKTEKSGDTLCAVAEEAALLEAHALSVLFEVSQRVQDLVRSLDWPASVPVNFSKDTPMSQIRSHG